MQQVWTYLRWAICSLAFLFLAQDMCVWPWPSILQHPSMLLLQSSIFVVFFFLAALPAALFFGIRSVIRRKERDAFIADISRAAISIAFAVSFVLVMRLCYARRTTAFSRASTNGSQVVVALRQYRADRGAYPQDFGQLIPEYINALPYTGLVGYPEFTYRNGYNDIDKVDDSYELCINCTSGGINFDRFIYWPSEKYPDNIQGNWTEPIGSWVYVHE